MKDIFIMTKGMGKVFLRFHVGKEDCSSTPGISLSYFQMCSWVSSRRSLSVIPFVHEICNETSLDFFIEGQILTAYKMEPVKSRN